MVVMEARQIVATSEEGGCQCRQFCQLVWLPTAVAQQSLIYSVLSCCPSWRWWAQATPHCPFSHDKMRNASPGSWQVTAADSCSGAVALVLPLWRLQWWRWRRAHSNLCMELDYNFCDFYNFFRIIILLAVFVLIVLIDLHTIWPYSY
jgi:hypothetical protein